MIKKFDNTMWYAGTGASVGMGNSSSTSWASLSTVFNRITSAGRVVKQIVLSAGSMSILCTDNTIWNTGYGSYGQLGNGSGTDSISSFVQGTVPNGITPSSIVGLFLMNGFISTEGLLYYTGAVAGVGTTDMTIYNRYTLCSQVPNTYRVLDYFSNASYFGIAIAQNKSTSRVYSYTGGGQYYGQLANGSTASTYISLRQTTQPSGDIIRCGVGYSYFSHHIITSTGVYAAGQNTEADHIGQLGTGIQSNASTYTKCVIPAEMDMNNVYVTSTTYRTYLTNGYHVYSTGQYTSEGGIASNSFVKDSPI